MAAASPQFTLVGFSPELDWRPLTFLKPIPANRVCSACGLVRKRTALLPCMHVLCECCYEERGHDGSNECPLDGRGYEEDDATLMDFSVDDLLRREVKCWNEGSGCQYTTAASGITEHFLLECEHHSVRCPRCSATVLCRDVRTHLRSTSCNISTSLAYKSQVPTTRAEEAASVTSFKGTFESQTERQAAEITACLSSMAVDIGKHGDRLSEISHGVNSLKTTLKPELAFLARLTRDCCMKSEREMDSFSAELKKRFLACSDTVNICLKTIITLEKKLNDKLSRCREESSHIAATMEQVKAEVKESVQRTLKPVTNLLLRKELEVAQCWFLVKGVKSLQDTAMEKGFADYETEKVYLRGYCMSPGVQTTHFMGSLELYARYTLHKGDMDDFVEWPFEHKIRMSVIHPEEGVERGLEVEPSRRAPNNQKPTTGNAGLYFPFPFFDLKDLISDGYVDNDQLRIKWELLP
ncbi:TNF receptor-associated factor 6-like [Amblyomma americanum]